MTRQIIFTVVLILIGGASFTFGLISCGSVNNVQTGAAPAAQGGAGAAQPAQGGAPEVRQSVLGSVASFLLPELDADKGLQKDLAGKSKQIMDIWAVVKVTNGVINMLQSVQGAGSESLSPQDIILQKKSGFLSFAYSVVVFGKVLLMLSGYIIFLAVIPLCALITIIVIWTYKDRKRVHKIVISTVLISLVVIFAVPVAFHLSSLLDKHVLSHNVDSLVSSIEAKGRSAESMDRNVAAARRQNGSIVSFIGNVKTLSNDLIEDVINYFIIFIFVFVIIPVLCLLAFFFFTRYAVRMILIR
ncbi:MAG: hypothetical protein FWD14_00415 [Treponema sp.]|nr:hypothetical protein [Treponema sp.]